MDHQKKLEFVLKMTKHALDAVQHFDAGGTAGAIPTVTPSPVAVPGIGGAINNLTGAQNNFSPTPATIIAGTNPDQLNSSYANVQGALSQSEGLSNALVPAANQGINSQNVLTQQLSGETVGQGPNPAQAALNLNTGQNIQQQAALAAGVRGAGSNAGLIAQHAANTGAAVQQQAVGQEALNQQQQQLNAQNQLATLAQNQIGQGTNAIQLANQTQQNEQNILQGANTAANTQAVSSQENLNTTNAQITTGNAQAAGQAASGIGGAAAGLGAALLFLSKGGEVPSHIQQMQDLYHPHLAPGGMVWQNSVPATANIDAGAPPAPQTQGNYGNFGQSFNQGLTAGLGFKSNGSNGADSGTNPTGVGGSYGLGGQQMSNDLGQIASPYGNATSDSLTMPQFGSSLADVTPAPMLAKGGSVGSRLKKGGNVPGKPKVNHDSYSNDTVSAKLSPGEVVIPIDVLHDPGQLGQMARFVAKNIERKKMGRAL